VATDVFIAYARVDSEIAGQVSAALSEAGLTVFLDVTISVAESWADRIEGEIRSARCVLALWTSESVDSPWVYSEARLGSERGILLSVRCDYETRFPLQIGVLKGQTMSWDTASKHGLSEVVRATREFINSRSYNEPA
jgi:hypothetical protein